MANHVNNHIQVEEISEEGQKVWDSFVERIEALPDDGHLTGLFYEADKEGYWIVPEGVHASEAVGAKWAFARELDFCYINVESAWAAVIPLVEHIAQEIGKVDPDVLISLQYEDEMPNFVGVATFNCDGLDTNNDCSHEELREFIFNNNPELGEKWDEDEEDWIEEHRDDAEDEFYMCVWEEAESWQIDNKEWSIK